MNLNRNPVIVLGCGFMGTNAIVKILMDMGYFMGEKWCVPKTKEMHPYETWEDAEIYSIIEIIKKEGPTAKIAKYFALILVDRFKKARWGFKCPNFYLYIDLFLPHLNQPKFICGNRDNETLISRMKERWGYTEAEAACRIEEYRRICRKLEFTDSRSVLWINQQDLLHDREKNIGLIKEFVDAS